LLYKPAHEAVLPYLVAFQCEFALRTILAEPESQFNLISKPNMLDEFAKLMRNHLKNDPTIPAAAVPLQYMRKALRRFEGMTSEEVTRLGVEIAVLGTKGLSINDTRKIYSIDSLGGEYGTVETIIGTTIHPVWSVDRQEWVPVAELAEGEHPHEHCSYTQLYFQEHQSPPHSFRLLESFSRTMPCLM
jgi:hypothetical protein